jgi:predicted DNA-binding protein
MYGGKNYMSKLYGFRLGTNDEDIEKILSQMTGRERSLYIKEAIRFYSSNSEKFKNISDKVEKILSILEELKTTGFIGSLATSPKKQTEISDENILIDSIQDLLNL